MIEQEISIPQMRAHIATGHAVALLDSTAPPCRLAQRWWAVARGETVYRPVQEAAQVSKLDDLLARKQASQRSTTGQS